MVRVMVVFGGRSGEHEVSLASARAITQALGKSGRYEVVPVGITREGVGSPPESLCASWSRRAATCPTAPTSTSPATGLHNGETTSGPRFRGRGLPCPAWSIR